MFSAAKDQITSRAARAYLNNLIGRYGEVQDLRIDSGACKMEIVCRLDGEVSPIGIKIERYRVEEMGRKKFVEVLDSTASRPWLQAVLRDHLHGRRFEVPTWAAAAL